MEKLYCRAKRVIFCQIFRFILHKSSSVARMSKRDKRRYLREGKQGENRKTMGEREGMRVRETRNDIERQRTQKRVGPPPPLAYPTRLQLRLSIVCRTGSHMSVFTYAPISSFKPFPDPHFWRRISRAS